MKIKNTKIYNNNNKTFKREKYGFKFLLILS